MSTKSIRTVFRSPILAVVLVVVFAGTALATSANGFNSSLLARGSLSETGKFSADGIKLKIKGAVDVATATITIEPGGSSGWHSHPGVVLVTVKSGTVTFYDQNCSPTVHVAGSSFIESDHEVGLARNESTTANAVVFATFILPHNAVTRVDRANPGCPQS